MSAHVNWMIIRNNSSFLLKGSKTAMSLEKNNLKGRNSFRYNGLIHKKTVGIESAADGKGLSLVMKRSRAIHKPAKTHYRTELKKDARVAIKAIRQQVRANGYRPELTNVAVRRACAVLKSQKPKTTKTTAGRRRE